MRTCPRCKLSRDPAYFVGRVSLCLVCYSTIPANRNLSAQELVTKMKRARINRAAPAAVRRSAVEQELLSVLGLDSPLIMDGLVELPKEPFTSLEDILNFTKKR